MEVKPTKMCRTCLAEDEEMHSLFEVHSSCNKTAYSYIIAVTTGVQVSECDGLPHVICTTCKQSAAHAYQFKQQSIKADVTLRTLIFKEKSSLKANTDQHVKLEISNPIKYEASHDYQDFDTSVFDVASSDAIDDAEDEKKETKKEEQSEDTCALCNSVFESDLILQSHLLICQKDECDEDKPSIGLLCGASHSDPQDLIKDTRLAHKNKKRGRRKLPKSTKKALSKVVKTHPKSRAKSLTSANDKANVDASQSTNCGICNVVLDSRAELNTHFTEHSVNGVICCGLCEKMFLDSGHFKQHYLSNHPIGGSNTQDDGTVEQLKVFQEVILEPVIVAQTEHPFPDQDMKLVSMEDLMKTNHAYEEDSAFVQVCTECGQLFFSPEQLIQHIDAEHHDLSSRCNVCSKNFSTIKSAARHRKVCKHVDRKHQCYTCGLKFAYELTLNKHILREHKGESVSVNFMDPKYNQEKKYSCTICTKSFFRHDLLDKHLKNHVSNDGMRYECDICKKRFNRKDNLRSHLHTHDPQRARAASNCLCLYCGRSFSNSSNLIVHMRRHTGEKPYKCDFCNKGFPRSSDLQCHRRSHTGEKPYLCNICGKGFRRNNKLSRHMRVHTGQRPYKCTYCEKAFSQSNDLTLHIRRHTGDKPYVCPVCGDRFIQGTALQNHRRAHNHFLPATSEGETSSVITTKPTESTIRVNNAALSHGASNGGGGD